MGSTTYDIKTDKVIYSGSNLLEAGVETQPDFLRLAMALLDQGGVSVRNYNKVMELLELDRCQDCNIIGGMDEIGYVTDADQPGLHLCRGCEGDRFDNETT